MRKLLRARTVAPESVLLIAALVIGEVGRCLLFVRARPWFGDEAALVLNLLTRTPSQLWAPMDWMQSAPPLYLCVLKAIMVVVGFGPLAMRCISLAAGLALPFALGWAARSLAARRAVTVAIVLAALDPMLIEYGDQTKPYLLDALAITGLIGAAVRVVNRPARRRGWTLLLVIVLLSTCLSIPVAMSAVAALALVTWHTAHQPQELKREIALGAIGTATAAVIVALLYWRIYRIEASPRMLAYWQAAVVHVGAPGWIHRLLLSVPDVTGLLRAAPLRLRALVSVSVAVGGVVLLWRARGATVTWLVLLPVAIGLAGSAAGRYPMFERLALFAASSGLMLASVALAWLAGTDLRRHGGRFAVIVAMLVAGGVIEAVPVVRAPPKDAGRALIVHLVRLRRQQPVLILFDAAPLWLIYTTPGTADDFPRIRWFAARWMALREADTSSTISAASDGDAVVWHGAAGEELLGVPTGMAYAEITGVPRQSPQPGWPLRDLRRLRLDGANAWIVGTHVDDSVLAALRQAMPDAGWRVTDAERDRDAMVWRITADASQRP